MIRISRSDPSHLVTQSSSFLAPHRHREISTRLVERTSEAEYSSETPHLVEKCRDVWGISPQRETIKGKELEGITQRWIDSIGGKGEAVWGGRLLIGNEELLSVDASTDILPCL